MALNPYAPPVAPVRDVSPQAPPQARPIAVVRACRLLWWSFGLSLLGVTLKLVGRFAPTILVGGIIGVLIGALLTHWFTTKLNGGRNWMRVLLTILTLLGVLGLPFLWGFNKQLYMSVYAGHPVQLTISLIIGLSQYALNLISVVLINTLTARVWFRQSKELGQRVD